MEVGELSAPETRLTGIEEEEEPATSADIKYSKLFEQWLVIELGVIDPLHALEGDQG